MRVWGGGGGGGMENELPPSHGWPRSIDNKLFLKLREAPLQ